VEAASRVGLYAGQQIRKNGTSLRWTRLEITSLTRRGFNNRVIGRFLEVADDITVYFTFDSAREMVQVGDIVAVRENKMSVWDAERERAKEYNLIFHNEEDFRSTSNSEQRTE